MHRLILLALPPVLAACGSSPPSALERTTGAPSAVVAAPEGFEDRSADPPAQVLAGAAEADVLHYFLAGTARGGLPIHIAVTSYDRPEMLPAEAIAARQAATTVAALGRFRARAGTPEPTTLAGVPAARYDVRLRAGNGARIHQRFVVAKRPGERLVHTAMLTAPSRALYHRHLPAFDAMLRRWRWNE